MPIERLIDPRRMRKALPRGFGWIDHLAARLVAWLLQPFTDGLDIESASWPSAGNWLSEWAAALAWKARRGRVRASGLPRSSLGKTPLGA
jgi:hypothetical protein